MRASTWRGAAVTSLLVSGLLAGACTGPADPVEQPDSTLPEGVTEDDLTPVETFDIVTTTQDDNASRYEAARVISEAWQQAGVPVEVVAASDAELVRVAFTGKSFDTYLIEYAPTDARLDPADMLGRFISSAATKEGNNLSGYENPDFDMLYEEHLSAESDEQRLDAVKEAQTLIDRDKPIIMGLYPNYYGPWNQADWTGAVNSAGGPAWNFWSIHQMESQTDRNTLLVAAQEINATLNPVTAENFEDRIPISLMYDSLSRIDEEGTPVPWAADSIEADGTTITAHIRQGMTFHDGTPVTPEDVAFSVNYLRDQGAPLFESGLSQVESVGVDGENVVFELNSPSAAFVPVVLTAMPILPEAVWASVEDPFKFENANPIGSGPLTFGSFSRDAEIRMARYDDHFDAPNASEVVITEYGNRDAMLGALETGDADLMTTPLTATQSQRFEDSGQVDLMEKDGFGWLGVHVNMRKAPFDDLAFREALSLATPRQDLIDIVYDGGAEPAGSVIAPVLKWTDPDLEADTFDLEQARELLEDAGYLYLDGKLYYPPERS